MNEQNLKPLKSRTVEEQREWHRKGGSVKSDRKKLSSRLRCLKQRGLTDASAKELYELMSEPSTMQLDILIFLKKLEKEFDSRQDKKDFLRLYLDFCKLRHGTKENSTKLDINTGEQNNVQINIIAPQEEKKEE